MDDLFAYAVFPAKVACQTCDPTGGFNATVFDQEQGTHWLRGHGMIFHNGPFEVGIWNSVQTPNMDAAALAKDVKGIRL